VRSDSSIDDDVLATLKKLESGREILNASKSDEQSNRLAKDKDSAANNNNSASEGSLDPLWMSRILQAQARIESRLGRRYYNTAR
jgi:hypothetical protein